MKAKEVSLQLYHSAWIRTDFISVIGERLWRKCLALKALLQKEKKSPIWSSLVLPCKSYLLVTNVQLLNRLIASHYIASKTAGPYLKIHKQWFWKLFMFLVSVIYLFQVTIMQCCRYLQCKSLMRLISRKNSSHLITQFIINKLIPSRELFHLWI